MPPIKTFTGWRYDPGKADYAQVTTPPYDVITPQMRNELYKKNDRNAVRIIAGREFSADNNCDNRYTRAAAHLDAWRSEGLFIQDKPAIYVYQQEFTVAGKKHARRGFFAQVLLGDNGTNGIYPHENTLSVPQNDRTRLTRALRAQAEPVFGLLTDPTGDISRSLYAMCQYAPVTDFLDDCGIRNQFWVFDDPQQAPAFCTGCSQEAIYIADGHHRYAAAVSYRNEVREAMKKAGQTPPALGELPEDYIMMYIVPDSDPGLTILPVHRIISCINGLETLPPRLAENFTMEKCPTVAALTAKMDTAVTPAYGWIYHGEIYFLALKNPDIMTRRAADSNPAWRGLEVAVLHTLVLRDLLGVNENQPPFSENIHYTSDLQTALNAAGRESDSRTCAFVLRPPTMAQVRELSRAKAMMPSKSTFFFPQPLSGMVFNFFW